MAPEQATDPVTSDGRADIYALGVTFYNLVTGKARDLGILIVVMGWLWPRRKSS